MLTPVVRIIPGSTPGSKGRNALSLLAALVALVVFLLHFGFFGQGRQNIDNLYRYMICACGLIYFYLTTISVVWLISDRFQINPIRFLRDILISAAYTIIASAFLFHGIGIVDTADINLSPSPSDYMYFSTVTFSTLGYGDFRPAPEARSYAAFLAVYGNIHLGLLVGGLFLTITFFAQKSARLGGDDAVTDKRQKDDADDIGGNR